MSEQSRYMTAAVCTRGHVVDDALEFELRDQYDHCDQCESPVITACPNCKTPIRGWLFMPGVFTAPPPYDPPTYCFECGKAFPWIANKVADFKEVTDQLEGVSREDRAKLKAAIDDIAAGGPPAEAAAARIKQMLGGNASTGVARGLWKRSVDIADEAAKKILLGG
jgi:hypothetical protein